MRIDFSAVSFRILGIAFALSTGVMAGCDDGPCLRTEDATRICERLYDTQHFRGERQAAVVSCYKAIHAEVGLAKPPTPTR